MLRMCRQLLWLVVVWVVAGVSADVRAQKKLTLCQRKSKLTREFIQLVKVVDPQLADVVSRDAHPYPDAMVLDSSNRLWARQQALVETMKPKIPPLETVFYSAKARPLASRSKSPVYTAAVTIANERPSVREKVHVLKNTIATAVPRMLKQSTKVAALKRDVMSPAHFPAHHNAPEHLAPSSSTRVSAKKQFPHEAVQTAQPDFDSHRTLGPLYAAPTPSPLAAGKLHAKTFSPSFLPHSHLSKNLFARPAGAKKNGTRQMKPMTELAAQPTLNSMQLLPEWTQNEAMQLNLQSAVDPPRKTPTSPTAFPQSAWRGRKQHHLRPQLSESDSSKPRGPGNAFELRPNLPAASHLYPDFGPGFRRHEREPDSRPSSFDQLAVAAGQHVEPRAASG